MRPFPRTIVAVEVQDQKNGATHYWTLEKLRWGDFQFLCRRAGDGCCRQEGKTGREGAAWGGSEDWGVVAVL